MVAALATSSCGRIFPGETPRESDGGVGVHDAASRLERLSDAAVESTAITSSSISSDRRSSSVAPAAGLSAVSTPEAGADPVTTSSGVTTQGSSGALSNDGDTSRSWVSTDVAQVVTTELEPPPTTAAPKPRAPTEFRVCWANEGLDDEKGWTREVVEESIEPFALVDFVGWVPCSEQADSEFVVRFAAPDAGGELADAADGEAGVSNQFVVDIAVEHERDGAVTSEEACAASVLMDRDGGLVDRLGRVWSSYRHYCTAANALGQFMHRLFPLQERYACVDPLLEVDVELFPEFGYRDVTSVFSECAPLRAYLSQVDQSLLINTFGSRPVDWLWLGAGSLGSLFAQQAPSLNDRLFVFGSDAALGGREVAAVGDFDGNGLDDLVLYGAVNEASDWMVLGEAGLEQVWLPFAAPRETNPVVGDFDGDGFLDLLWYKEVNDLHSLWFGAAAAPLSTSVTAPIPTGMRLAVADFDGDGYDDIFLHSPSEAQDYVYYGSPDGSFEQYTRQVIGSFVPIAGDFDGDGLGDVFLYRPGNESEYMLWGTQGRGFVQTPGAVTGHYSPAVGDFDGNGVDDILWAGDTSADPLWLFGSLRGDVVKTYTSAVFRRNGSVDSRVPYAGDFDGNGLADVLWM